MTMRPLECAIAALPRLRLFQLVSPSLPIGGFTYSQGMERAVEEGWLDDVDTTRRWLTSVLTYGLTYLDLPAIKRMYEAVTQDSPERFARWSAYLLASRETSELRQEELQRARALVSVVENLPGAGDRAALGRYRDGLTKTQGAGFALAGATWGVPLDELLAGYAWSWLENGVNAAVKLVPLGQTAGQGLLFTLSEQIPALIDVAGDISDDELGASMPALAIASALHETQYCRLFRS